jgi:mevalonate kinase
LEVRASAPGKLILFGEHAVVYGEPSVSLAVDRRTSVRGAAVGDAVTVNGRRLNPRWHRYILQAVEKYWEGPLRLQVDGDIPSSSGMGSSAALSVATVAVVLRLAAEQDVPLERVARAAYETELETQAGGSPNDTTVSTAGGGVLLAPRPVNGLPQLWTITKGPRTWVAHRVEIPQLPLVVAFSGKKGNTAKQVAKVRRFVEKNAFGRDLVQEIGSLTRQGVEALADGDLGRVGVLMDRNQEILHTLGVDTPELSRLIHVARKVPGTYGAKLTGAGGGGSIIALTSDPNAAAEALTRAGADAFRIKASERGVEAEAS